MGVPRGVFFTSHYRPVGNEGHVTAMHAWEKLHKFQEKRFPRKDRCWVKMCNNSFHFIAVDDVSSKFCLKTPLPRIIIMGLMVIPFSLLFFVDIRFSLSRVCVMTEESDVG